MASYTGFVSLWNLLLLFGLGTGFPQQGIWDFNVDQENNTVVVTKTVYANSSLYIKVNCENDNNIKVKMSFVVWVLPCFEETVDLDVSMAIKQTLHNLPKNLKSELPADTVNARFSVLRSAKEEHSCGKHTTFRLEHDPSSKFDSLTLVSAETPRTRKKREDASIGGSTVSKTTSATTPIMVSTSSTKTATNVSLPPDVHTKLGEDEPVVEFEAEGVYRVSVMIESAEKSGENFDASIEIEIKGKHGYLSAVDWPLLPFYGVMCALYVLFGVAWLVVSACQWRDLLRIQFWIGGVILLGMLEKAVLYAEYQSINSTGRSVSRVSLFTVQGAIMFAEVVSCLKRTLARMLVIIVSLGFGIVKPRLGPLLHRVVGVGGLYFILSVVASAMQIYHMRNDPSRQFMVAEIALAVLDSAICWWIFSSVVQTTRTLRLRRNVVKLSLYRHFTNTLIFAVLASIAYTVWYVRSHRWPTCLSGWKELWVDEAYWRLLFSVILIVIMILWRPTNNNQRYAFTPLLDAADDEEDEPVVNDAFEGMKMRGMKNSNHVSSKENHSKGMDDDLKWVEENIPSTIADAALPSLLDSDEEIMTTKFEISKMN